MFYVYILYSSAADRYYVGHTDDVHRRVEEHNHPKRLDKYTAKYAPWVLQVSIAVGTTRAEVMKVERFIKQQKSRLFILKIIALKNYPEQIAQLVRVPHRRD